MSDGRDEVAAVRRALDGMTPTLEGQLPPHIPPTRFISCVMTAVQKVPKLLTANRDSLYLACKEAAEDGLLPDGREGAIVPRWDNKLRQEVCAWQPMVTGLVKLAWQCGGIAGLHADTAYDGEVFEVHGGTAPRIVHRYDLTRRGNGGSLDGIQAVYAVAKLMAGETMQAVLTPGEIEKIRAVSKAEKGPWKDWPVAMAQVRAVRRLCKLLPLSADREADARMRRAAERGDVIDGVAEDTTDQRSIAAPDEGGKLGLLEQGLGLPEATEPEKEPVQAHQEERPAEPAKAAKAPSKAAQNTAKGMLATFAGTRDGRHHFAIVDDPKFQDHWARLQEEAPTLAADVRAAMKASYDRHNPPHQDGAHA